MPGDGLRLKAIAQHSCAPTGDVAYEAMACGRPVVASRTASTAWVLRDFPDRLVAPRAAAALAGALMAALGLGAVDYVVRSQAGPCRAQGWRL